MFDFDKPKAIGIKHIYAEMEYDRSGETRILAEGIYKDIPYLVVNTRGTHPCGYVNVAHTKFEKLDYMDLDCINCHGGLTYSSEFAPVDGENAGWWLGWDYAHLGDYNAYTESDFSNKYTTEDVVNECIHVIDQIVGQ